ncbi:adenylate cyclase [Sphingopyxis panaciterrulae]|uniref:FtsH-binding integral membrane protein n=1 Tax=Sphingopyxis panaciterrulae TaxID=462372 RepID=A0A7W9B6A4_9SPHN|nr:adenylate cyclase [Sphingopyxis panaciterrulae]MBB5707012.1 FtsH-binding integral membrane protein [Sphingopyxis panaciterrulae]
MATIAGAADAERFWQRMAIGLAVFIVFGFAQFTARGFVDPLRAPFWVHLHGAAMLGWLALLIVQPTLVSRRNLVLHRRLGWVGAALALVIACLGVFIGAMALVLHRQPPFFTPPFFLALTAVESLVFGAMAAWAIRRRRATDWHRRLMIGATIVVLEPALGRLLPIPLMGVWAEPAVTLCQLAAVAIVAAHDRRTRGAVHPATWAVAAVVIAERVAISLLAMTPPVIALAARLAGG